MSEERFYKINLFAARFAVAAVVVMTGLFVVSLLA